MADNLEPSNPGTNRIFDVAKPGQFTPADATSRPVIVANRPIMRDPMMASASTSTDNTASDAVQPGTTAIKVTVKPILDVTLPTTPSTTEAKSIDGISSKLSEQSVAPADTGSSQVAQVAAAREAELKMQVELDELVDKKQYFLPINTVEKRRSKLTIIGGLILIVLLGLVLVNFMLDAGFIQINGMKSVTHFFTT